MPMEKRQSNAKLQIGQVKINKRETNNALITSDNLQLKAGWSSYAYIYVSILLGFGRTSVQSLLSHYSLSIAI